MRQRLKLLLLVAVVLACFAGAWVLVNASTGPSEGAAPIADDPASATPETDNTTVDVAVASGPVAARGETTGVESELGVATGDETPSRASREVTRRGEATAGDMGSTRESAGGEARPGGEAARDPATVRYPASARVPSTREASRDLRRGLAGRQLLRREDMPAQEQEKSAEEQMVDLAKLGEPEVWQTYWHSRGMAAPAMVATPLRAKLMDVTTLKEVADATVTLFTFFPATDRLSGPVLPVAVPATTDKKGFIAVNMPTPTKWPESYPALALNVRAGQFRLVEGFTVATLRRGELNELGVFWAPHEPCEVDIRVGAPDAGLAVACFGQIDPLRWSHEGTAGVLSHLHLTPISGTEGVLRTTWDPVNPPPFVALVRGNEVLMARRCELTVGVPASAGVYSGPGVTPTGNPFHPVTFANDSQAWISGTVVDHDGGAVPGAKLSIADHPEIPPTLTDAIGWFSMRDVPVQTATILCEHADYVAVTTENVERGTTNLRIVLEQRRPKFNLAVANAAGAPVREVWLRVKEKGEAPVAFERCENPQGRYAFEWPVPIATLHVCAPGFEPAAVPLPPAGEDAAVVMTAGLRVEKRPRDYTAAQWPEGWKTDGDEPQIWSLDDDHWVEYAVDLGAEEHPWHLVLGVKNHTWGALPLDNEYEFIVHVHIDGAARGVVNIASSAQVEQFARVALGSLSGAHTIRFSWDNDRYIPGQLDANIQYQSIRLMRVP